MKVDFHSNHIVVSRDNGARANNESHFWHLLSRYINSQQCPVEWVKQGKWYRIHPHKFAMTSMPHALRLGKNAKSNKFILDNDYAIRNPATTFNRGGEVTLLLRELS